jgi:nucleoside-diphosphate-sugar epimerase
MLAEAGLYKQRQILITGGLGFIGLNLSMALLAAGARVRILDVGDKPLGGGQIQIPLENVQLYRGDLADENVVSKAVDGCEVVFNLAGRSGAAASIAAPVDDLEVNARGQLLFLETCRRVNPTVKIVFPSSRLVYKPTDKLPVPETAELGPLSIYGIHKMVGEQYHLLYSHLYGMRTTLLRITNPYGAFQQQSRNHYGIINWFIQLAINRQPLPVYGDGLQFRDYVHIDDVVRAFLLVGNSSFADGQIFNVGWGKPVCFREMAELVVKLANAGKVTFVRWPKDAAASETGSFVADIRLIERAVGWRPKIPLEVGLGDVICQYKKGLHQ